MSKPSVRPISLRRAVTFAYLIADNESSAIESPAMVSPLLLCRFSILYHFPGAKMQTSHTMNALLSPHRMPIHPVSYTHLYETLRKASIEYKDAPVYIPPYEYYNKEISAWAKNMGCLLYTSTSGHCKTVSKRSTNSVTKTSTAVLYRVSAPERPCLWT